MEYFFLRYLYFFKYGFQALFTALCCLMVWDSSECTERVLTRLHNKMRSIGSILHVEWFKSCCLSFYPTYLHIMCSSYHHQYPWALQKKSHPLVWLYKYTVCHHWGITLGQSCHLSGRSRQCRAQARQTTRSSRVCSLENHMACPSALLFGCSKWQA